MDKHLYDVAGLSTPTRSALEELLGRSLKNDEQVYLVAIDPPTEKPTEARRNTWQRLQQLIDSARTQGQDAGTGTSDIEKLIDETCEQVRYGDKPCA